MKKRFKKAILITLTGFILVGVTVLLSQMIQTSAKTLSEQELAELETPGDVNINSSYYYLPVGTYDSADTAILEKIDPKEGKVTLYNTVAAKTYTLNYDGTTYVSDKYGTAMSMSQMEEGTIVNVNFFKATRQLVDMSVSADAWSFDSVKKYDLEGLNSTASIGDRTYALTKGVQVFSQGVQTDLCSIVKGDTLTVSGIGYDIYSIKVDSGHGYVRLTNDEALIGGWIEIGNELITKVSEESMLMAVPEGSYTVHMYNETSSVFQDINVGRNQEVILDCSDITAPVDMFGRILFHVTPDSASLMLDGEAKDISGVVKAEYGIHHIEVSAPGYDTLSRYISVGNELSEISVNLDESVAYVSGNGFSSDNNIDDLLSGEIGTDKDTSTVSGNQSKIDKPKTATGAYRVYVFYPDDVEVYLDGVYQGVCPVSFKKVPGTHTITLSKAGYETRSYTIHLTDDSEDVSLSFSALEPLKKTDPSANSIEE